MTWIHFALIFSIAHAAHSFFIKLAGDNITPAFAMIVSNIVVLTGSLIIFFAFKMQGVEMTATKPAIIYVTLGGLAVIVFELALFYMFNLGAPLTYAYAITRILPLILVVGFGTVFFHEAITAKKAVGMVLGILGIWMMVK